MNKPKCRVCKQERVPLFEGYCEECMPQESAHRFHSMLRAIGVASVRFNKPIEEVTMADIEEVRRGRKLNQSVFTDGDGSWPVMEHFGKSQIEEILPLQDTLNGSDNWPVVWITREEAEKMFPRKPSVERITDTFTCTRHLNPVEDIPVGTVCPVCQFGEPR